MVSVYIKIRIKIQLKLLSMNNILLSHEKLQFGSACQEETKLWGHSIVCISLILGNYENWRALTLSMSHPHNHKYLKHIQKGVGQKNANGSLQQY